MAVGPTVVAPMSSSSSSTSDRPDSTLRRRRPQQEIDPRQEIRQHNDTSTSLDDQNRLPSINILLTGPIPKDVMVHLSTRSAPGRDDSSSSSHSSNDDSWEDEYEYMNLSSRRRPRRFSDSDRYALSSSSCANNESSSSPPIVPTCVNFDAPQKIIHPKKTLSCPATTPVPNTTSFNPPAVKAARRARKIRQRSKWLISADHPLKILWDIVTVTLSLACAYMSHTQIRDRSFDNQRSGWHIFCQIWFLVDILLNFVTEHKTSDGKVIRNDKAVWARYLTTWFAVDCLSLVPWEYLYVKPVIDMQNKRGFFKKSFFRTKAVIRVTRVLRGRHFQLFGKVARETSKHGVGWNRLLTLIIKYVPKYLLFYRNMKGVLAVRILRWIHSMRKVFKGVFLRCEKDNDDDDDDVVGHIAEHVHDEDDVEEEYEEEDLELEGW